MNFNFNTLFELATNHPPYAYQQRLACGGGDRVDCQSLLIDIPTGLGKTAAVVMAWLWNRVLHPDATHRESWPRRLVYCLPMRTLVEQTRDEAKDWIKNLVELGYLKETDKPRVIVLMGGETLEDEEKDWDLYPERTCILIGTQDMLLSRALNRGYGMSRARWPMHFGLLNNDCLWVLDETQLMGVGVTTAAQLDGLREKLGRKGQTHTWWASATLDQRLIETPDRAPPPKQLSLNSYDKSDPEVLARVASIKKVSRSQAILGADTSSAKTPYIDALAGEILAKHQTDSLTIVILNRVDRARELYSVFEKRAKTSKLPPRLLIHSRFRPMEREKLAIEMQQPGERILIATQAIEAGVDLSARTLFTELAPWSSLIQRFGRCNRKGEFNADGGAEIHWIDLVPENEKAATGLALPYDTAQLDRSRSLLESLSESGSNASPQALRALANEEPLAETHVLRRRDLVDLFDTTPDLAGLDLDVGRYIRDGDDRDVQIFWRDLEAKTRTPDSQIRPQRPELVRVAVNDFKKFAQKQRDSIWTWDALDGEWVSLYQAPQIAPGRIYLLATQVGGYAAEIGWTGDPRHRPDPVLDIEIDEPQASPRDGPTDDESDGAYLSLTLHTSDVVKTCREISDTVPSLLDESDRACLLTAALWHDVGKAQACFQHLLKEGRDDIPAHLTDAILAKSKRVASGGRPIRPHFRHELASALAWLSAGNETEPHKQSLIAYLIASHHGKVRLSLRAMPGERIPVDEDGNTQPERLYARGVWDGEYLPGEDLPDINIEGVPARLGPLDLALMRLGGSPTAPSWTNRILVLRDAPGIGPFRLAWLETILRAADGRASAHPSKEEATSDA